MKGEGFERPVIKAIESAATKYVNLREEFQKASARVQEAKTKLIAVMQANSDKLSKDAEGNSIYRYNEELVILSESVGVKVKALSEPEED